MLVYEEYFLAPMALVVLVDDLFSEFAGADWGVLAVSATKGQNQRERVVAYEVSDG
jgi:hypothetical protein